MSFVNRVNCRKFSLVMSFALLCLVAKSQFNFSGVEKFLSANQKALGNDLVTLIYKDGKMIYQQQMGDFTIKTNASIGSCSKWFTAALVMTFVDEGKISLDDKVSTYLPIFEKYKKQGITIRQCLSHQTGIEDNINAATRLFERHKYASLEQEVNSFAQRGISANPGTTFIYGNIGPDIAGRVLEVISKMKFDALVKQRIFIPLNMRNSSFTPEDNQVNPSGGAVSTPSDYMNFLAMLVDKGMFMGKRILSEAAISQMQTIQTKNIIKKYSPKVAAGYEYGLGEWIEEVSDNGNSSVVSCPGMTGTWPFIDKCRNYACIFFIKNINEEKQKELYLQLKKAIDQQIPPACK
ncbi:MAG: serine hydrolase domain-containing protein [Ferruginibacter sp.]